ncbi:hypothetical protein ACJMK2_009328, partial [Sinanodonta woodiana]
MPLDTFICGGCMLTFNDIELFVGHKKKGCESNRVSPLEQARTISENEPLDSETASIMSELSAQNPPTLADGTVINDAEGMLPSALLDADLGGDQPQTVIILQDIKDLHFADLPISQTNTESTQTEAAQFKPRRKRGRAKKTEEIAAKSEPLPPEKGKDGKLICVRCKRSFNRERFFTTHKCLASSDFVDISQKDVKFDSGDEEGDKDMDREAMEVDEEYDDDAKDRDYEIPTDDKMATEDEEKSNTLKGTSENINRVEVQTDPDIDSSPPEKATDTIGDIPVFKSEEEKVKFEQSLNVDLSCVDHMFRVHVIEQDLNENAFTTLSARISSTSLSLYSCNMCDKVFKTLSHMRLHCLIHTELKPFKCPKCSYSSNCRGNLYTHMRKHTGQFYKCSSPNCQFKTVNKSHLIEHEATHSNIRHPCEVCKKDYNTIKSLINHVRKYHTSKKGKEYLQTFQQGRDVRGSTVIHQCHVCNRKFKKKIDRDRHLFVHDIRDIPNIQCCELCDYMASRRVYLEKHFQKHRVIYRCSLCDQKFLSSLRLIDHLTSDHLKNDSSTKWEKVFEDSINHSVYLPEPDETLPSQEKDFVNLPPELSRTHLNTTQDDAKKDESQSGPGSSASDTTSVADGSLEPSCFLNNSPRMVTGQSEQERSKSEKADDETDSTVKMEEDADQQSSSRDEDMNDDTADKSDSQKKDVSEEEENAEEGLEESTVNDSAQRTVVKGSDLIQRLGYLPMTMQIFQKMRDTFGNEECEFCGRLFYNKSDYEPHVRTHTGEKPFACPKCGYRTITKDNLKRHFEKEHENATYPCNDCDFIAVSRTQLWNHQLKHKGLKGVECPECDQQFESVKQLRNHVIVKHPDANKEELQKITGYKHKLQGKMGRRSYKCPHCDKLFFRANSELQKHIWIHEGIKPFKCPMCPHACRSKNNLQAHMLRHSTDKPFVCTECGKAYKSKTALRWHVRSHKDGKIFKCDKCSYEATQRSHLKRHMETHEVTRRFACAHCDYSSNTHGYLKIHYTRFHKGLDCVEPIATSSPDKTNQTNRVEPNVFKCLSCDYLFGNLSDLKRHLKIRHHIQVQDIKQLEAIPSLSEVQVLHYNDDIPLHIAHEQVGSGGTSRDNTMTIAESTTQQSHDPKKKTAVNILQRIIDMSQQ